MNSNSSYCPETHNSGQNRWFFVPCDIEIWRMTLKNNRDLFYATLSFVHHLKHIGESNLSYSPEMLNSGQNRQFFLAVWPRNFTDDVVKQ